MTEGRAGTHDYLPEATLYGLLDKSGINARDFDELDSVVKERLELGLSKLWRINKIGTEVEEEDKEIARPIARLTEIVEDRLKAKAFAAGEDWMEESTRKLVELAKMKTEPEEERRQKAVKVLDIADAYWTNLQRGEGDLEDYTQRNLLGDEANRIYTYLGQRRDIVGGLGNTVREFGEDVTFFLVKRPDLQSK